MSRKWLCIVLSAGVITGAFSTPGLAQRVWVGGGGVRVRAPFVRVDVDPQGGVFVRAPFTAVDVPPRAYYPPDYPLPSTAGTVGEPSFPTADALEAMDDEQLRHALRTIAGSLHHRLRRFDTGDTWQHYLRLPEEILAESATPDVRAASITTTLERFRRVKADPQFVMIARLPAFLAMEAALNEALSRMNEPTSGPPQSEDLPLPPQQNLSPPQRPTDADRNGPFLKPKPPQ